MNSDLLLRPFFSQGLSSGFHGCLSEFQKATASGHKWGLENRRGGGKAATDVSREGIKISFCTLNSIFFFSLTLIIKLEMDSFAGKILTLRCNEMTVFFFKKKS